MMEELEALLERDFILKSQDRQLYYAIKDNAKSLVPFLTDKLGYNLLIRNEFVRLEKLPGRAEPWMGLVGFSQIQEYVFFMLMLVFLEDKSKDDQFLLSQITDFLLANQIGEPIDWTSYRARRNLIQVLKFCLNHHLLQMLDGEEDQFMKDSGQEMLLENTGLSKYFLLTLPENLLQMRDDREAGVFNYDRGDIRKHRVYRRLLLSPIVYNEGSDDQDYAYIKNFRGVIADDFQKYLGWQLQVHRNGTLLLAPNKRGICYAFPSNFALADIVLQVNERIVAKIAAGEWVPAIDDTITVHEADFAAFLQEVRSLYEPGWSKEYRECTQQRLQDEVKREMGRFLMLRDLGETVVILPLAGKIIGRYPKDFAIRGEA